MEAMRESWTDERLDRLSHRVDEGFSRVDHRFELVDQRFEQVDQRFEQVDQRFEQVDQRFEQVGKRLDRIETDLRSMGSEVTAELRHTQRLIIQVGAGTFCIVFIGFLSIIGMQLS
jgi:DNA anti-recombination protein RmuC